MDYEFTYDEYGTPIIRLEMGQEATAQWLNTDIGNNHEKLSALLELIDDLQKGIFAEKILKTRSFEVQFTKDEVDVLIVSNEVLDEQHKEDGLTLYDDEHTSGCGLEDLKSLLEEWKIFI